MAKDKRPKDTNAPKRPLSAYMLFSQETRPQIMAENKDLKITQASKVISQKWKEIDASDKKKFEDKASKLKADYDKTLATYKKSNDYKKYQKQLEKWKQDKEDSSGSGSGSGSDNEESSNNSNSNNKKKGAAKPKTKPKAKGKAPAKKAAAPAAKKGTKKAPNNGKKGGAKGKAKQTKKVDDDASGSD